MRLAVWNANMAVHRKLDVLLDRLRPDVAVVPECADPSTLEARYSGDPPWSSMCWAGRNATKGLAVFGFGDYSVSANDAIREDLEWIIPVDVAGPVTFALLAVWSMNQRARFKAAGFEDIEITREQTFGPEVVAGVTEEAYRDEVAASIQSITVRASRPAAS